MFYFKIKTSDTFSNCTKGGLWKLVSHKKVGLWEQIPEGGEGWGAGSRYTKNGNLWEMIQLKGRGGEVLGS